MDDIRQLIDNAISPILDELPLVISGERYIYTQTVPETYNMSPNLRLDFETVASDSKVVRQEIHNVMSEDLVDLIVNGDVLKYTDPLLQTFDGAIKRNQTPRDIQIKTAHLVKEYKPEKKSYEWTIWFRLYVDWVDNG